jgi:amino acid adenylation domain-containing protein
MLPWRFWTSTSAKGDIMATVHLRHSLPELFAAVCARQPRRTAAVCGSHRLTYAELAARARGLAADLVRRGVARGDFVGVRVSRSLDVPVAILGVMLAGAAYVPLDPRYPPERLRLIEHDARIEHVVEGDLTAWGHQDASSTGLPELSAEDRAYVIYTSGSTGRPKGCVITHGNVLSLLDGALPLFDVGPDDRWTLFHSINFDFSVWEVWGALASGGTVVIVDDEATRDPEVLLELLVRERVTVLNQVPSAFRLLAEAHTETGRPSLALRYLIFGGDAVDLDVTAAFVANLASGVRPINMYGITETTVHVTYKELDAATLHGANRSPIGRALPHLDIVLRREDGTPAPEGDAGEIWVSGGGVGAGYLHRDELTAERFVIVDGVRHYRSGDLARRLPDGELEFLGRADRQVKLRGFRIEPAEIEGVLRGCTGVRDAAVALVAGRGAAGDFLMAYLVADAVDANRVREECGKTLPSYMVPTRFDVIPAMPHTSSGKVDRAALAERTAEVYR